MATHSNTAEGHCAGRRPPYHADPQASAVEGNIHDRHTQANAIKFVDYVIDKFPFRITEIRTDNRPGHFLPTSVSLSAPLALIESKVPENELQAVLGG